MRNTNSLFMFHRFKSSFMHDPLTLTLNPGEVCAVIVDTQAQADEIAMIIGGYKHSVSGQMTINRQPIDTQLPDMRQVYSIGKWSFKNGFHTIASTLKKTGGQKSKSDVLDVLNLCGYRGSARIPLFALNNEQAMTYMLASALLGDKSVVVSAKPIQDEVLMHLRQQNKIAIICCCDIKQAFAVADQVVWISHGSVIACGKSKILAIKPPNMKVAELQESGSWLDGTIVGDSPARTCVDCNGLLFDVMTTTRYNPDTPVKVYIPDEAISFSAQTTDQNRLMFAASGNDIQLRNGLKLKTVHEPENMMESGFLSIRPDLINLFAQ